MTFKHKMRGWLSAILILSFTIQGCRPAQRAASPAVTAPAAVQTAAPTAAPSAIPAAAQPTQPAQPALPTSTVTPAPILAAPVAQKWDFTQERSAQGWKPANDLAKFSFDEQGLQTRSTGGDPYMNGPAIELDAKSALNLEIRMRSTKGSDAQVFWEVDGKAFNEPASQHFTTQPDGEWHTYRIALGALKAWQGRITRLRLDPTAQVDSELSIAWIQLTGARPAELKVLSFGPLKGIQQEGQPFTVQAVVSNTGDLVDSAPGLRLDLPADGGLTLADGSTAEVSLSPLEPGKTAQASWTVRSTTSLRALLALRRAGSAANDPALRQVYAVIEAQSAANPVKLENANLRLTFAAQGAAQPPVYSIATLEWNDGAAWRTAGRLPSLGQVLAAGQPAETPMTLLSGRVALQNANELVFDIGGAPGDPWTGQVSFKLEAGKPWIQMTCTLQAGPAGAQLLSWRAPEFLAGEGAFGAQRSSGLFPGLEFLAGNEQSSGTDYADASVSQRYVPHPNKITIPLMSVSQGGLVTGMLWDPLQSWDGSHDRPAALYASPNTWDGQDNHLMALLAPGMTAGLAENRDRLEGASYALPAGKTLTLSAALFATAEKDTLTAVETWLAFDAQKSAALPAAVRPLQESLRLSLDNYTKVTWVPEKNGWHYVLNDPWGPGSDPAIALHLWLATLNGGEDGIRTAYRDMVRSSLSSPMAGGQPNVWLYQPALNLHLAASAGEMRRLLDDPLSKAASQQADGSWGFANPSGSAANLEFGKSGDSSNGYTATSAFPVLYFARLTGDTRLVQSGLKALAYLEKQTLRPEGAQTWELALHVPDVLASAWVSQAFLEGYRLTGETRYLDQAQRWAFAGLPFVYLWNPPDRPLMRYTTIPVFGATNFTYPWFGRPVMWNGLDYAMGLQGLAEELKAAGVPARYDWRRLAEGITLAASQMQPTSGPYLGMYPDAWDNPTGMEAYTWWLTPSYLAQNILMLQNNRQAQANTLLLELNGQKVHVTAPTAFTAESKDGSIQIKLSYPKGEKMAVMVSPLAAAPQQVWVNGVSVQGAWSFEQGILVIPVTFTSGEALVSILP